MITGTLTLGENIADSGGLQHAYFALKNKLGEGKLYSPSGIGSFTHAQLFFISFGQSWCNKATVEEELLNIDVDPHSPPPYRVLGALSNFDEFSTAFKCPNGSVYNRDVMCRVW